MGWRLIAVAAAAVLALGACGEEETGSGDVAGLPAAGGGGSLIYALPSLRANLDPLTAASLSDQVVSRQIHEPLVSVLAGPYGGARHRVGLASALRPSPDRTVWSVQLRPGVVFQDGTPFNAAAVLANSRRWASVPAGRRLLPDLFGVDAPRPNEVRFQLDRPVRDLPRLLADPRLGIVSPQALDPPGGEGSQFRADAPGTGTGPFQHRARGGARMELARNPGWWGSSVGLGPAFESLVFLRAAASAARVGLLRAGEVEIAGPLPPGALRALDTDPLLRAVPGAAGGVGVEASVRGLDPAQRVPPLSGVWLTRLQG